MINQQLVDYVKQQMQAGISKDAVRKALSDAGWSPADIDDSLKAAEPAAAVQPLAASQPRINPTVAMGGADPVKAAAANATAATSSSSDKFFSRPATTASQVAAADDDEEEHPSVKKFMAAMIAMGAVILILAGTLVFVYFNLNGGTDAPSAAGDPAQLASLQQQVSQLATEKEGLTAQVQTLTADNGVLVDELGFFVVASGTSTAPMPVTVKGALSGNASTTFALTTSHNVKVLVANSKDAKVAAALTPLVNGTSSVTLGGTHLPGSLNLTVTSVNGAAL